MLGCFITARCIPLKEGDKNSSVNFMEDSFHPWIIYFIMPVFAFANTSISFVGINFSILSEPIMLGIILGLFVCKQLGIFSILAIFKKLKLFKLGESLSNLQLYGISLLCGICGIGFTMSFFIEVLAFNDNHLLGFWVI
ncbi:hypothetical protein FSC845_02320 [Francisella persica ATCC VR-331]|nr:hypothetical protein FSC845_02320 [Francisella persica ATCC VR-331]